MLSLPSLERLNLAFLAGLAQRQHLMVALPQEWPQGRKCVSKGRPHQGKSSLWKQTITLAAPKANPALMPQKSCATVAAMLCSLLISQTIKQRCSIGKGHFFTLFSWELWTSQSCMGVMERVPCLSFTQLCKSILSQTALELKTFLTAYPFFL